MIENSYNGFDVDLLTMYMVNGSVVEIRASQISEKMPYYLTMQNEVTKYYGKDQLGIYHLDVGNCFSPL